MKPLTPKQQAFVREYLVDLNASAAYRRAGYTSGNPNVNGPRLLAKAGIQAELARHMAARSEKVELTAEQVLREIKTAAFLDPLALFADDGTLLPLRKMPEAARRAIAGLEVEELYDGRGEDRRMIGYLKKIKLVSKEGTLTLAGRHLGMFVDKRELSGPGGGPIQMAAFDMSRLSDADLMTLAEIVAKAGGEVPAP